MQSVNQIKNVVTQGYNKIALAYAQERDMLKSGKYVKNLLTLLKEQSYVLDLGCGSGVPVAQQLIHAGHLVVGLDISKTQVQLARKNCPTGSFSVRDIETLKDSEFEVDAVVSLYTFFHIPRQNHLALLKKVNSFLGTGGYLLVTMGDSDFEGYHQLYGERMWSSHFAPQKNSLLVTQAGFEILTDEIDYSGREKHQFILARKV